MPDLVKAICPKCKIKVTGIRPGEKLHEELVGISESENTIETKNSFIILQKFNKDITKILIKKLKAKKVDSNFSYKSNNNKFLSIKDLKSMISKL